MEFKWNLSTDENGDSISYTIEISESNEFSKIAFAASANANSKAFTLEKGVAYYWRVKAVDNKNSSSAFSSVFRLYTEGVGELNHLPYAPELVSPELNTEVNSGDLTLSWTANDVDVDDLTYDVYLDTNNTPTTLVSENQSGNTVTVTVVSSTSYFWKIVAKDDKGGSSIGQVWSFKTN